MPTNLNALIRYKQIDACLRNPFAENTIKILQKACTKALGDHRGLYKRISERTIRDDIRVMRSDILGFNAPIECTHGRYTYLDKNYSIFKTPITEIQLLKEILKLLLEKRDNFQEHEINPLLIKIAEITGDTIQINNKVPSIEEKNISAPETKSNQRICFSLAVTSTEQSQKPNYANTKKDYKVEDFWWRDVLKVL